MEQRIGEHAERAKKLFHGDAEATAVAGRDRRRRTANTLRKEARDKLISAKRRRAAPGTPTGTSVDLGALAVDAEPNARLHTLQALREKPQMAALPGLLPLLQQQQQQAGPDHVEQALWCVSGLIHDADDADVASLLGSGVVPLLVRHCPASLAAVWALANLAAHDSACRRALRAAGAVEALQAAAAASPPPETPASEWLRVGAWALCQLVRGPNTGEEVAALFAGPVPHMAVQGANQAAQAVLAAHATDATPILAEHLWTCSYLSAGGGEAAASLVALGVVPALVTALQMDAEKAPAVADARLAALRCIGNLFSSEDGVVSEVLGQGGPAVVPALGRCLVKEPLNSALCREATWALANLTGGRKEHAEAVVQAGLLDPLMRVFAEAPFAEQVEAGFALLNLARLPEMLLRVWNGGSIVGSMLKLMRAQDGEAVALSLRFVEHMLEHGPREEVVHAVRENDGLAALEDLRMVREDLSARANRLIDAYIDPMEDAAPSPADSHSVQTDEYPPWRLGAHQMQE